MKHAMSERQYLIHLTGFVLFHIGNVARPWSLIVNERNLATIVSEHIDDDGVLPTFPRFFCFTKALFLFFFLGKKQVALRFLLRLMCLHQICMLSLKRGVRLKPGILSRCAFLWRLTKLDVAMGNNANIFHHDLELSTYVYIICIYSIYKYISYIYT